MHTWWDTLKKISSLKVNICSHICEHSCSRMVIKTILFRNHCEHENMNRLNNTVQFI